MIAPARMNELILGKNNLVMKLLWNLDTNTYEDGAQDTKTKEMPELGVRQLADAYPKTRRITERIGESELKGNFNGKLIKIILSHYQISLLPVRYSLNLQSIFFYE